MSGKEKKEEEVDTRMELYSFNGSPWSFRVVWAISLLPKEALENIRKRRAPPAEKLKSRVESAKPFKESYVDLKTISFPMLFFKDEENVEVVIRDGLEIVAFLAEKYENDFGKSLLENYDEILDLNLPMERVMRHFRAFAFDQKDNSAIYFMPSYLSWIPFLARYFTNKVEGVLRKKYYEIGMEVTEDEINNTFQDLNERIEKNGFVLESGFSYADIILCAMMEFVAPTRVNPALTTGTVLPTAVKKFNERGYKERFPLLYAHREKIFADHFTEETLELNKLVTKQKLPEIRPLWDK